MTGSVADTDGSILPHRSRFRNRKGEAEDGRHSLRWMSLCVTSLHTTLQPHLLSSFYTRQGGTVGGYLGTEAKAQVGDSGDSEKAAPGWGRVPWLRRGGHRLGETGATAGCYHTLCNIYRLLGSFKSNIQVPSSAPNNVGIMQSANIYWAPCARHCTRLGWGHTNSGIQVLWQLELGGHCRKAPAPVEGRLPGGGDAAQDPKSWEKRSDWLLIGASLMTSPPKLNPGEKGETLKGTKAVRRRSEYCTGQNKAKQTVVHVHCHHSRDFPGCPFLEFGFRTCLSVSLLLDVHFFCFHFSKFEKKLSTQKENNYF